MKLFHDFHFISINIFPKVESLVIILIIIYSRHLKLCFIRNNDSFSNQELFSGPYNVYNIISVDKKISYPVRNNRINPFFVF